MRRALKFGQATERLISAFVCAISMAMEAVKLVVGNPRQSAVFRWSEKEKSWQRLPFKLPEGARIVDEQGRDAGLRFVDIDEDGQLDVLFSDDERYSLHLFADMEHGWSREAFKPRKSCGS